MTFSGVASNFAGVPLAFAFLATLGRIGLVTVLLRDWFGINIYALGFNILSFCGPDDHLPVLPDPADGADHHAGARRPEEGMARGRRDPRRHPVRSTGAWSPSRSCGRASSAPSLLLFANAFGAIATAYALTGSSLNIVPILLYAQIRGDVLHNPNLGYALALGMIVITGLANIVYIWFRMRAERWLK